MEQILINLVAGALARISHTIFARSRDLRDELIRVSGTCSLVAPEDASGAGTVSGLRVGSKRLISVGLG